MVWILTARRDRRLVAAEQERVRRRMAREDVTTLGEQVADLHVETLTTTLDEAMRADYQAALDAYEEAKSVLTLADEGRDDGALGTLLDEGRFRVARVLARRDGEPLPARRDPCFFDPRHGPAVTDLPWTPSGGVERSVPVCRTDEVRLTTGMLPQVRMVAVGDRLVPWWAVGDQGRSLDGRRRSDRRQRHAEAQATINQGSSPGFLT
ncbi:hypothetical protein [Nocardioides dongkuii]|uniref:hypothetical protein n=1 Tax=Nocardioides dongkuii TaxID=2760089 RepID=UPI0015F7AFF1|nr:hypothetical protein [Nocardioides dongkuii]